MTTVSLKTVIDDLDAYRAKIEQTPGDDKSRQYAFADSLKQIQMTEIGRRLLQILSHAIEQITIFINSYGKNYAQVKGNEYSVHFDPNPKYHLFVSRNGMRQVENARAPATGLFHELVHMYRFIFDPEWNENRFTLFQETPDYESLEEWNTINGKSGTDFSENAFRKQIGEPLRISHASISEKTFEDFKELLGSDYEDELDGLSLDTCKTEDLNPRLKIPKRERERILGVVFEMITYGLEFELKTFLNRYIVLSSDFNFLAFNPSLCLFYDKYEGRFDAIRENLLMHILVDVIIQTPGEEEIPTKVFLNRIFNYHAFSHDAFLEKLAKRLTLDCIIERTPILQLVIEQQRVELLCNLVQQKGIESHTQIWHPDKKELFTLLEYAQLEGWDKDQIAFLQQVLSESSSKKGQTPGWEKDQIAFFKQILAESPSA